MTDPNFEFNAPKFYDFERLESDYPDANIDNWFETSAVKALTSPADAGRCPERGFSPAKENQPQIVNKPVSSNQHPSAAIRSNISVAKKPAENCNLHNNGERKRAKFDTHTSETALKSAGSCDSVKETCQPSKQAPCSKPAITLPHSPQLATAKRVRPPAVTKTSQELEWERVMRESAVARRQLKENEEHYKKALQPSVNVTKRSTKPLTQPQEFELQTNKRQRLNEQQAEAKEWKSMAQQTQQILKREVVLPPVPSEKANDRTAVTDPKAPNLSTAYRARPSRYKTREQLEEEEMARMPTFHARPVSKQVLHSRGEVGIPRTEKRPVTEPQPFSLQTEQRAQLHAPEQHSGAPVIHSRRTMLEEMGHCTTAVPKLTIPQSPALATKQRAAQQPLAKPAVGSFVFKAQPLPDFSKRPVRPKRRNPTPKIQPEPFSLKTEQRGEMHHANFEAAIAEAERQQQAARNFKAQPIPLTAEEPEHPGVSAAPLTIPEPFPLRSVQLHGEYEKERQRQLQQEEQHRLQMAQFKARPVPVAEPFVVQPSGGTLTVPESPHLAVDERAVAREYFDAAVSEKMRLEEELKALEAKAAAEREAEEVKEYRKKLQFKARAMPDF